MATWTISTLERNTADGGVVVAHWRCIAEDGDFSATAYGTVGFTPDASSADFVPYADLTEADVLAWVWGSVDKAETEAALAANIADQQAPKTESGLPW